MNNKIILLACLMSGIIFSAEYGMFFGPEGLIEYLEQEYCTFTDKRDWWVVLLKNLGKGKFIYNIVIGNTRCVPILFEKSLLNEKEMCETILFLFNFYKHGFLESYICEKIYFLIIENKFLHNFDLECDCIEVLCKTNFLHEEYIDTLINHLFSQRLQKDGVSYYGSCFCESWNALLDQLIRKKYIKGSLDINYLDELTNTIFEDIDNSKEYLVDTLDILFFYGATIDSNLFKICFEKYVSYLTNSKDEKNYHPETFPDEAERYKNLASMYFKIIKKFFACGFNIKKAGINIDIENFIELKDLIDSELENKRQFLKAINKRDFNSLQKKLMQYSLRWINATLSDKSLLSDAYFYFIQEEKIDFIKKLFDLNITVPTQDRQGQGIYQLIKEKEKPSVLIKLFIKHGVPLARYDSSGLNVFHSFALEGFSGNESLRKFIHIGLKYAPLNLQAALWQRSNNKHFPINKTPEQMCLMGSSMELLLQHAQKELDESVLYLFPTKRSRILAQYCLDDPKEDDEIIAQYENLLIQ